MGDEIEKVAEWETLNIAVEGPVATITLCRPDLLNRFDAALHREFVDALSQVRENPKVRAAILASTGRVFSAGGDFDWMREMHDDLPYRIRMLD